MSVKISRNSRKLIFFFAITVCVPRSSEYHFFRPHHSPSPYINEFNLKKKLTFGGFWSLKWWDACCKKNCRDPTEERFNSRARRAFLQALCVTRARVLSFPLRVPRSRVLFQSFFFAYQDSSSRVPNFVTHSSFACLKKKISMQH